MKYILSLIVIIGIASCRNEAPVDNPVAQPDKTIVCTTGMVADLVGNIVGDAYNVKSLMGPGVDPHLYKATQGDLRSLRDADIIIYNGLHLEGKMTSIFEQLSKIRNVVALSEFIAEEKIIKIDENEEVSDPHIWFDVSLWASSIDGLIEYLCKIDEDNCESFKSNGISYKEKLMALHSEVNEQLAVIPESQRILITAHDAFEYFGKAYNIKVRGLQGISTLSEFGLRDRIELVRYIVENKINAVFVESSVPRKNIEAIVEGCQKKGHQVIIGGSLYSDAMGEAGTTEGTYIGMVKSNVRNIIKGLTQTQ